MRRKWIGIVIVALAAVATSLGCGGRQFVMQGADRAAGADGRISIEQLEGGNYQVEVQAENLLPPTRLAEDLTTYVVWFQPPDQQPQRVGVLAYNPEERSGRMMATTAHPTFQVIVTGETAANVGAPSEQVAFRGTVEATPPAE